MVATLCTVLQFSFAKHTETGSWKFMAKSPLAKLEDKVWEECRRITFLRSKAQNGGLVRCYTCGALGLEGRNCQCGHLHPKGACGASIKFDLRLLRPQCFQCNINYGGMGAVFRQNMEKEIGKKQTDKLMMEAMGSKGKPIKAFDHYTKLLGEYQQIEK